MDNLSVCFAFRNHENAKGSNLESHNGKLRSYGAVIAQEKDGHFWLNITKYSRITSKHQNYARMALKGIQYTEVHGQEFVINDITKLKN